MHTNDHDKLDPNELRAMGYEKRDLNMKPVLMTAAVFVIFTVGSAFISGQFFNIPGVKPAETISRPFTPSNPPAGTPVLQTNINNTEDITTMRQREIKQLSSSGPSETDPGFYHISIDQALALTVQKNLIPSAATDASAPKPTVAATSVPGGNPRSDAGLPAAGSSAQGASGAVIGKPAETSSAKPSTVTPADGKPAAPQGKVKS